MYESILTFSLREVLTIYFCSEVTLKPLGEDSTVYYGKWIKKTSESLIRPYQHLSVYIETKLGYF